MADIELGDVGNGGDRLDIVEGQAVAGMRLDAVLGRQRRRLGDAAELDCLLVAGQMRVAAGVELDDRRAEANRRLDLGGIGLDEQADADAGSAQSFALRGKMMALAGGVEPALGGPLLALLGDDAGGMRPVLEGDRKHLLGRRHLEIERHRQFGREAGNVLIGDVPPVLAQMGGDTVGAGLGGEQAGAHRVGIACPPRVPDRRDMVDIDPEAEPTIRIRADVAAHAAARLPGLMGGIAASSGGKSSAL